jgi:hypothetical protein
MSSALSIRNAGLSHDAEARRLDQALAGKKEEITEYSLGLDVFGKRSWFDTRQISMPWSIPLRTCSPMPFP